MADEVFEKDPPSSDVVDVAEGTVLMDKDEAHLASLGYKQGKMTRCLKCSFDNGMRNDIAERAPGVSTDVFVSCI